MWLTVAHSLWLTHCGSLWLSVLVAGLTVAECGRSEGLNSVARSKGESGSGDLQRPVAFTAASIRRLPAQCPDTSECIAAVALWMSCCAYCCECASACGAECCQVGVSGVSGVPHAVLTLHCVARCCVRLHCRSVHSESCVCRRQRAHRRVKGSAGCSQPHGDPIMGSDAVAERPSAGTDPRGELGQLG